MSPILGKCIAAVTKVTLADFQLFFPASVSTSSLLLGGGRGGNYYYYYFNLVNAD